MSTVHVVCRDSLERGEGRKPKAVPHLTRLLLRHRMHQQQNINKKAAKQSPSVFQLSTHYAYYKAKR